MLLTPCSYARGTGSSSRNQYSSELCHLAPIELELGDRIEAPQVAYQLLGPVDGPVVLVLGGISASHAVCERPEWNQDGWWAELAGPARALDTRRYRVLSLEYLGGNGETSGPRNWSGKFPQVTTLDQARLIASLLDELGIEKLHALVGASFGGMVGLQMAAAHGDRLERLVVLCAAHKPSTHALANRLLQRKVVQLAQRLGEPSQGLELARALAMIGYRTEEEFQSRFDLAPGVADEGGHRFDVGDYLLHQGRSFAERFHPEAFLRLSEAIDLHRVDPARIGVDTDLICFESDRLIPAADMRQLREEIAGPARLHEIPTIYGHDAFLKEYQRIAPILCAALDREVCA